jgi:Glycosyl transferases group 1
VDVPAYLQHADLVIVPHRLTPFTRSLDPIKAYESLAIQTPVVATPVAGFVELADCVDVVPPGAFVSACQSALARPHRNPQRDGIPTWDDRAEAFEQVLVNAAHEHGCRGAGKARPTTTHRAVVGSMHDAGPDGFAPPTRVDGSRDVAMDRARAHDRGPSC